MQNDKKTPGLEKGFLVQVSWYRHTRVFFDEVEEVVAFSQVLRYALNRLQSLNEFCVICDEKHVLESGLIKVNLCGV